MSLWMTEGEIRSAYRQAADRKKQVKILAELNAVEPEVIRGIVSDMETKPVRRKKTPKKAGGICRYCRWTPEEDRELIWLWEEKLQAGEIAAMMGRTEYAVRSRISELKKGGSKIERTGKCKRE